MGGGMSEPEKAQDLRGKKLHRVHKEAASQALKTPKSQALQKSAGTIPGSVLQTTVVGVQAVTEPIMPLQKSTEVEFPLAYRIEVWSLK